MISVITVGLIFLIVTISVGRLKRKGKIYNFKNWLIVVSIILIFTGLVFIFWQDIEITNELDKRNWKQTEGVIINSEIVGNRAVRAEIKYQYTVNDSVYFGNSDYHIPGFGTRKYREKNARIVQKDNPMGKNVIVYFNPDTPAKSTLRYGPYYSNYMIIGFGCFVLFIGMFVTELGLIKKYLKK